jgi:ribonuclease HI
MSFLIFADGACSGNPGPGGWSALILDTGSSSSSLVGGECLWGSAPQTTNNVMELTALLRALEHLSVDLRSPLQVALDSTYVLSGAKQWRLSWRSRDWKKSDGSPVANLDLWKALDRLLDARQGSVEWVWVEGHAGIEGNEFVDQRSVEACRDQGQGRETLQFSPSILEFSKPNLKSKQVYLSWVDGALFEDPSWAECEARVKGKRGARFKKVASPAEREACLRSWGVKVS